MLYTQYYNRYKLVKIFMLQLTNISGLSVVYTIRSVH